MRAPLARCSTSTGLAIANVLGTGVELNRDCLDDGRLDPAYGLVAVAAAPIVSGFRLAVVEKSRLATAVAVGCAGIAPMHRCHWSCKYGLGVQVGFTFKLETDTKKVKEEQAGAESNKNLKAVTSSPA